MMSHRPAIEYRASDAVATMVKCFPRAMPPHIAGEMRPTPPIIASKVWKLVGISVNLQVCTTDMASNC